MTEPLHHGWIPREHDYDPEWDYEINYEQLDDPLILMAQAHLERLARLEETPFCAETPGRVFPCSPLHNGEAVAVYCNGTYLEPAILIDLDAHKSNGDLGQIIRSINHEVYHSIQDSEGLEPNEEDAELWLPFF